MTKGIFITATGTDAGKTYVSALIVKKMREAGLNCGYYKPVLSGAIEVQGKIIPGDCNYVKNIAGLDGEAADYLSYCFKPAVSPHLAAKIENNPINIEKISEDFEKIKNKYDYIVVEGAGGIVCPMDLSGENPLLIEDIIKKLDLDIIIVAPAALGSINSAVTTAEYAKNHGIKVQAFILNHYNPEDTMQADNRIQIEKLAKIPVITTVKDSQQNLDIEIRELIECFKEI